MSPGQGARWRHLSACRGVDAARNGWNGGQNPNFADGITCIHSTRGAWIASNCHEPSRHYYQRKRAEGKKHNATVMCLARRRNNVIDAMFTNREFYREPSSPPQIPTAA